MVRLVVSIVLLPCLLLTQSAARGHAHPCDPRPHFHIDPHHDHDSDPPAEHDETAVYLAADDVTVAGRTTVVDGPVAVGWVAVPVRTGVVVVPSPAYLIHSGHSPPTDSPLYVKHRALLI